MEEFHESSVVLPLGKYHSTSTIASSRLRLAAVRGAVYPPGYRYLCDLLFAFVWARYVVGSCLQRALVSRTRPSPTRSSGRPSRSMLSRSIPEGCFLKPTSSGPRPSVGMASQFPGRDRHPKDPASAPVLCPVRTGGHLRAHPGQDCCLKAEGSLGRWSPAPRLRVEGGQDCRRRR